MAQQKIKGIQIDLTTIGGDLGAITPTSVAAVGTVTGSNLSGTNTGDQTITLTSDVTGSGTGSFATTLATVNGSPQTDTFRKLTVNGKGLVTATSAVVATDITTALTYTPVNKVGDTMTGLLVLSADPSAALGAATKQYVDTAIVGLSWKTPVVAATTANIALSTTQTIDGIAVVAGNRVLVKNQSTASQNGIYIVAAGAWARAPDFDATSPIDEVNSAAVFVVQGTTQADTGWTQTAIVVTVGTDPMVFAQFAGSGSYVAGSGLTLTGNSFALTNSSVTVGSTNIALGATSTTLAGLSSVTSTAFVGTLTGASSLNVLKTGDTMSGSLAVTGALSTSGNLTLNGVSQVVIGAATTSGSSLLDINLSDSGGGTPVVRFNRNSTAGTITRFCSPGTVTSVVDITSTGLAVTGTENAILSNWRWFRKAYIVATATNVTIEVSKGLTGLVNGTIYRIRLMTVATSTVTGAVYIVYQTNAGVWAAKTVTVNTSASNFPQLGISGTTAYIFHGHASTYDIEVQVEANLGVNTTVQNPSFYGIDGVLSWDGLTNTVTGPNAAVATLTVGNSLVVQSGSAALPSIIPSGDTNTGIWFPAADTLAASTTGVERIRIDSSGNVLVGATTGRAIYYSTTVQNSQFQIASTSIGGISIFRDTASAGASTLSLGKTRGTSGSFTAVIANDDLGAVNFAGADGTTIIQGAAILASVDGTVATDAMPGRLQFLTTPAGGKTALERMRIDSAGNVGIGVAPPAGRTLSVGKNVTGATTSYGIQNNGTVQSDVTANYIGYNSQLNTVASAFTVGTAYHYLAAQGTIGATSAVTNQVGFLADNGLIGATNNFGFYGNIPAAAGRWNLYMNGSAQNYILGNVGIGSGKTVPTTALDVNGTVTATAFSGPLTGAASLNVLKTGDTMTGSLQLSSTAPSIRFTETDQGADLKDWFVGFDAGTFQLQTRTDAYAYLATPLSMNRTGFLSIIGPTTNFYKYSTDTIPYYTGIIKARGTAAVPTTVVDGDDISEQQYYGHDGTSVRLAASIVVEVEGTPATTTVPGRIIFRTTPAGSAQTPLERMRIASTGLSTFTTSGLSSSVAVVDTGANGANIRLTGNGGATPSKTIAAKNGLFVVTNDAYTINAFSLSDSGIGTFASNLVATSDSAAFGLYLKGRTADNIGAIQFQTNAGVETGRLIAFADGALVWSNTSATERFRIGATGLVGIGAASSGNLFEITRNQNAATVAVIRNTDVGASASSILQLTNGTKYVNIALVPASNYLAEQGIGGIVTKYTDYNTHYWRNNAGADTAVLDSTGNFVTSNQCVSRTSVVARPATSTHGFIQMNIGTAGTSGYIEIYSHTSGVRQGYIGYSTTNAAADAGTLQYVSGTHAFTGAMTIAGGVTAGSFSGSLTGAVTGNASTATTLQTARNINGVSFNGSADITVTAAAGTLTGATLAAGVTGSSLTSVGTITAGTWSSAFGAVSGANLTSITGANITGTVANATNASIAPAGTLTGATLAAGVTASSLTSVGALGSLAVTGNVGIGITATAKLDINGNQATNIVTVAALDIDCSQGNYFIKTIAGNSTFTFSNIPASRSYSFTLELTHTSGTVTWPASVQWPGATAPSLTVNRTHLFVFITDDGGTRWRGASSINYTN